MEDKTNKGVKIVVTGEDGEVREFEGEGLVFCIIYSEEEKEDSISVHAAGGVVGRFSPTSMNDARERLLETINNTEVGKAGALLRALEDLNGALECRGPDVPDLSGLGKAISNIMTGVTDKKEEEAEDENVEKEEE